MLETLHTHVSFEEGFSLTGKQEGILACHNALCTLLFLRAGKRTGRKKEFNGLFLTFHLLRMNLPIGMARIFFIALAVASESLPVTMV